MVKKNIELLAPAGDYESFIQAINNGADAIYMAGKNFNARSFVHNFELDEIIQMIKFAHSRDVKVYVTVNTLIKDSEIMDALKFVEALYKNNVDAILVQDIGLINILRKAFPNLPLHASTQMNVTTVDEAKKLKDLGFERIVLARECNIDDIKKIKENVDIELEVFCHGALCMSYSGNCFMSSLIGGRSGNRGKCAQSCRQEYSLEYIDENNKINRIDKKYYLSCKDLMTIDRIDELKKIGVDSIKIEGRGKEKEYVATVTKWYRNAIDGNISDIEKPKKELKLVFNRKFTKGYIFGEENKYFTNIETVNHIGVHIGKVIFVEGKNIYIRLEDDLNLGDCIRLVDGNGVSCDAIIVNNMYKCNESFRVIELVKEAKAGFIIKIYSHNEDLFKGLDCLKTKDAKIIEDVKHIKDKKLRISGIVSVKNKHLALEVKYKDIKICKESISEVDVANNPEYKNRILEQISKTGEYPYVFESLKYFGEDVFLPIKDINELRRDALDGLEEALIDFYKKEYNFNKFKTSAKEFVNEKTLFAKVRTKEQSDACIQSGLNHIIFEDEKLYDEYKNKCNAYYMNPRLAYKDAGLCKGNDFTISSVYKNITNIYAVNFMHEMGVNIVGLSIELSKKEIVEIINRYIRTFNKKPNVMMQVYGRYEMMLMKHCPINKAYGYNKKGCLECEKHQYYLRDKKDYDFPIIRTIDCNVKLLNSRVTSLIDHLRDILKIGVNNLLLDFTIESFEETLDVVNRYVDAFENEKNGVEINVLSTHGAFTNGVE